MQSWLPPESRPSFLTKDFTPDYNSGLAHAVFYALTSYPVIEEKHLHGEVVGFGVLLLLLVDGQMDEFEKIYQLNKDLKLPVSLEEIEITEEQWKESLTRIPDMSDIRHYPYRVTPEMLEKAMEILRKRNALLNVRKPCGLMRRPAGFSDVSGIKVR